MACDQAAIRAASLIALTLPLALPSQAQPVVRYEVAGDAIPSPLTSTPGDPQRGRAIVASRQTGLCLLCHTGPLPEERFQGNLAPDLAGAGSRYTTAQLRLRIADTRRLNPASFMPSFHTAAPQPRTANALAGKLILSAQQIEDVVAYLATLR